MRGGVLVLAFLPFAVTGSGIFTFRCERNVDFRSSIEVALVVAACMLLDISCC